MTIEENPKESRGGEMELLGIWNGREPDKVKPLAQYLAEYVDTELDRHEKETGKDEWSFNDLLYWLHQALDAYENTEGVVIKIERK